SGRLDLRPRSPTLDARAELPNASVRRILAALGKADLPADANVTVTAQLSGTVQNPSANLHVSATDIQAFSEPFGTLSADGHLENQILQLDNLSLNKPEGGQLSASGRYDMSSSAYSIKANGNEFKLTRLRLPDGTAIAVNLSLNADSTGNIENPS